MAATIMQWVDLSLPMFVLAGLAILAGSFIQGLSGLGLGLVAAPVLIIIDPRIGPGPLLAIAILLSAVMMKREFGAIDREGLAISLVGRVAGSIVAGFIFAWLTVEAYELLFGIFILTAVALSVLGLRVERTPWHLLSAGFTSGIMGTLTGSGSPTIALIYQRADGPTVRATLSAFFLASSIISLAVLIVANKMGPQQWALTFLFLPVMYIGFAFSNVMVKRLPNDKVRWFVLALAGSSSVLLIARGVIGLASA